MNLYLYSLANPANFFDPSGHFAANECDPPFDRYMEGFSLSYGGSLSGMEEVILGRRRLDEIFFIYTVEWEWVYDFIHGEWAVFTAASQSYETSLGISVNATQYQGTIDGFRNYTEEVGIEAYKGEVWNNGFNVGVSFLNVFGFGYTQWRAGPANQYATNWRDMWTTEVHLDRMTINYTGYYASVGYSETPLGVVLKPLFPMGFGASGALFGGPGVAKRSTEVFEADRERMAYLIETGLDPSNEIGIRPILGGPLFNPKRKEAAEILRSYSW